MRGNVLVWLLISVLGLFIAWWWFDPVGFYRNPLFTWFKGLGVPLPEITR